VAEIAVAAVAIVTAVLAAAVAAAVAVAIAVAAIVAVMMAATAGGGWPVVRAQGNWRSSRFPGDRLTGCPEPLRGTVP
jgi:hypothetical protein